MSYQPLEGGEREFLVNCLIILSPTEDGYLAHVSHAIDRYRE